MQDIIDGHALIDGPLLPLLHEVQKAYGFVSEDAVRMIAHALNLSRAEVHGVVSFYHDFKSSPDPRPVIKLCRAEACKARGVEAIALEAEALAGTRIKIEPVYCLGLCSVGPAAMVNGEVYARLTRERLVELVEQT
ncbi:MAG: NAD(P)H-dependent oxidoreductase subunit E [Sphingorhabdus sp.]